VKLMDHCSGAAFFACRPAHCLSEKKKFFAVFLFDAADSPRAPHQLPVQQVQEPHREFLAPHCTPDHKFLFGHFSLVNSGKCLASSKHSHDAGLKCGVMKCQTDQFLATDSNISDLAHASNLAQDFEKSYLSKENSNSFI